VNSWLEQYEEQMKMPALVEITMRDESKIEMNVYSLT
jgi:hypothetical protein